MKQKLPNIFKPDGLFKLTRLGNKFDGGYLIGESTVLESKCLISLGTGLEISFEKDYSLINKNKIFLVDNKKVSTYFKNEFLISLNYLRNFNFKPLFQSIKKFFLSNKFHNDHVFLRRHITYNSLNEILSLVDQKSHILIKIDIEGSEYRILDSLLENNEKFIGMIIEFHDVDLHIEKISKFISEIPLVLTHIHSNNIGQVDQNNNPTMLEMTFEKKPTKIQGEFKTPNKLDFKNDPYKDEIENYLD